jgi:hypothetical protein
LYINFSGLHIYSFLFVGFHQRVYHAVRADILTSLAAEGPVI